MKRSLLVTALTVGVVAALLGPASPSSAYTGDAIKVELGKTVKIEKEPIPGNSTVFQANYESTSALPADCAGEPVGCEVVPLELQIPEEDPEAIEAKGYILTVVVDWDPGVRQDTGPATVYGNKLENFLYQDPLAIDSSGSATYTSRSNSTQPSTLVAVSPTSNKFQLVVANFSGVNNGYTVEISLTDAAALEFDAGEFKPGDKPATFSNPTFNQPNATPQQNGFGGASGSAFIPPAAPGPPVTIAPAGPAAFKVPNIAGGKADPRLLAMSEVDVRTGLGLRAVNVESTVATMRTGSSSGTSVLLGLLALPLLIGAGVLFVVLRRRKGSGAVAPTAA